MIDDVDLAKRARVRRAIAQIEVGRPHRDQILVVFDKLDVEAAVEVLWKALAAMDAALEASGKL